MATQKSAACRALRPGAFVQVTAEPINGTNQWHAGDVGRVLENRLVPENLHGRFKQVCTEARLADSDARGTCSDS
eukprot:5202276-Amphidinium_carterae.1